MADAIISGSCKLAAALPWEAEFAKDEDTEDSAILRDSLLRRNAGQAETISLDDLERETVIDGLLPG